MENVCFLREMLPLRGIRLHLLFAIFVLIIFLLLILLMDEKSRSESINRSSRLAIVNGVQQVPCTVDDAKHFQCLRKGDEVFFPFHSFIRKQFDATGAMNGETFEYHTSFSKIRVPESASYDPTGEFGHFASYNVEIRNRVRCINAEQGVPMSVQWDSTPYFYPIQIGQFALQHYSQYRTGAKPVTVELFDIEIPEGVNSVKDINERGYSVTIKNENDVVSGSVSSKRNSDVNVLLFLWTPLDKNAWFSVEMEETASGKSLILNYKFANDKRCVWMDDDEQNSYIYSLGVAPKNVGESLNMTLDLSVDALKAVSLRNMKHANNDESNDIFKFGCLRFYGSLNLEFPVRLQSSADMEMFLNGAKWFLSKQDAVGGWPVPVKRNIVADRLVLEPGWHSAMAQGHAISVLARAYHVIQNKSFVDSIRKAFNTFRMNTSEGGVVNRLFGYDWFEEYPTTPGTFVLNGFIYSLIGLYDATAIPELRDEARQLFDKGIDSLKIFLPLYDTGSGSTYDLRHLGLKTAPNLARWDYHAVHIYLLKWLFNITGEKLFNDVAEQWIAYAHGRRAKHN